MKTVTITPEGYACKTDNIPIETFSIDFIEPDVSAASTSFRIQLEPHTACAML